MPKEVAKTHSSFDVGPTFSAIRPTYEITDTLPENYKNRIITLYEDGKKLFVCAYSIDEGLMRLEVKHQYFEHYNYKRGTTGHAYMAALRALHKAMTAPSGHQLSDHIWIDTATPESKLVQLCLMFGAEIVVRGKHAEHMTLPGMTADITALRFGISDIEAALALYDEKYRQAK